MKIRFDFDPFFRNVEKDKEKKDRFSQVRLSRLKQNQNIHIETLLEIMSILDTDDPNDVIEIVIEEDQ